MSITISNPSAHGTATTVVSEQPVRAPLAGNIPGSTPTLSVPIGHDAQVVRVPDSFAAATGGKLNRA
jgi:hypothetical protein